MLSGEFKGSLDPFSLLRDKLDFTSNKSASIVSGILIAVIHLRRFPSTLGWGCLDLLCFI